MLRNLQVTNPLASNVELRVSNVRGRQDRKPFIATINEYKPLEVKSTSNLVRRDKKARSLGSDFEATLAPDTFALRDRENMFIRSTRRRIVAIAEGSIDDYVRTISLAAVCPIVPNTRHDQIVNDVIKIGSTAYRAVGLSNLSSNSAFLSSAQNELVLKAIDRLRIDADLSSAVKGFGEGMAGYTIRQRKFCLALLGKIKSAELSRLAHVEVASGARYLSKRTHAQLISTIDGIEDSTSKALGIEALSKSLSGFTLKHKADVVNCAISIRHEGPRSDALANVGVQHECLTPSLKNKIYKSAQNLKISPYRLVARSGQVGYLSTIEQDDIIGRAYPANELRHAFDALKFIAMNSKYLDAKQTSAVIIACKALGTSFQGPALVAMYAKLPTEEKSFTINQVANINNHWVRIEPLGQLAKASASSSITEPQY